MRRESRESLPGIRIQGFRYRSPGLRRFGKRPTLPWYTHMIRPKYPITNSYADKKSGVKAIVGI